MLCVFLDVEYLLQARQISNEDAQLILSKVPQPIHVEPAPAPPTTLVQPGSSLQLTTLPTPILNSNIQPAASPPAQPPHPTHSLSQGGGAVAKRAVPPPPKKVQARALWDYNIDGDVRDPVLFIDPIQPPVTRPRSPSEPFLIAMTFSKLSYTPPITTSYYHLPAIAVCPTSHPPTHTHAHTRVSGSNALPTPYRNQRT